MTAANCTISRRGLRGTQHQHGSSALTRCIRVSWASFAFNVPQEAEDLQLRPEQAHGAA